MALYEERGFHSPYFQAKFIENNERVRRSSETLSQTVTDYIDGAEETQWGLTYEDFMRHLDYQCDACYGDVEINDTCDRIVSSTCKDETCIVCDGAHEDCENTCDGWSPSDGATATTTEEPDTEAPETEAPETEAPATEAPTDTTTEAAVDEFDPSTCPDEINVSWVNQASKILYKGSGERFSLLNIVDRKTDFAIRENDYTGYGVMAKKNCGNKFIEAMKAGDVKVHVLDTEDHYYQMGDVFHRDDGSKSHVTFSWSATNMDGTDEGTAKKDQVYVLWTGLDSVEWGNKDVDECISQTSFGVIVAEDVQELGCVAWSKTIW